MPAGDVLDLTNLFADGLITPSTGGVTYTSADEEDGFVTLRDGTVINFEEIENVIVCFTHGTMIVTDKGEKPVEKLVAGDKVLTKDNGLQELRWIGSRTVPAKGNLAPIMIKAGAMANDRDLMVSPQHRMVVEGWKSELLFGEREVLAARSCLRPAASSLGNGRVVSPSASATANPIRRRPRSTPSARPSGLDTRVRSSRWAPPHHPARGAAC